MGTVDVDDDVDGGGLDFGDFGDDDRGELLVLVFFFDLE